MDTRVWLGHGLRIVAVATVLVIMGCRLPPEARFIRELPRTHWDSAFRALPPEDQIVVFRYTQYSGPFYSGLRFEFDRAVVDQGKSIAPYLVAEIAAMGERYMGYTRRSEYSPIDGEYLRTILSMVSQMRCEMGVPFDTTALDHALSIVIQTDHPEPMDVMFDFYVRRSSGECDAPKPAHPLFPRRPAQGTKPAVVEQDRVSPAQDVQFAQPEARVSLFEYGGTAAQDTFAARPWQTVTPHDFGPLLVNRDEIDRIVDREYPEELRGQGVRATTDVWLHVNEGGEIVEWRIDRSSGYESLDRLVAILVETFRLEPPRHHGEKLAVWTWVPIRFDYVWTREGEFPRVVPGQLIHPHSWTLHEDGSLTLDYIRTRASLDSSVTAVPQRPPIDLRRSPVIFAHWDVPPRLTNPEHIRAAVARRYPRDLRERGIGGTVMLHLYIDETGVVQAAAIQKTSGNETLDRIAVLLAAEHRFTPAKYQGRSVPVSIQQPVRFEAW